MGKEQQSSYYDAIYESSEGYAGTYRDSHYFPTWALALQLLDKHAPKERPSILDIGCGTGQFAQFLFEHKELDYTGVDFSGKATEIARKRNYLQPEETTPPMFICANAFSDMVWREEYDAYIIMETLEHIEKDLLLLSKVPQGKFVILTVPTFDDAGHVRYFKTKEEALNRYGKFLGSETSNDLKIVETIRSWFIIYGFRNSVPPPIQVTLE